MPETPLNHFCILVPQLDEAIEQLNAMHGLSFHPAAQMRFNRLRDPQERTVDVRATMSVEGPPFVELIQATEEDGIFGRARGFGVHHVGVLESCLIEHREQLGAQLGVRGTNEIAKPDGDTYAWFSDPETSLGVRFEFIDDPARQKLMAELAANAAREPGQPPQFQI